MVWLGSKNSRPVWRNLRTVVLVTIALVAVAPSTVLYAWSSNDITAYQTKHPWFNPNDTCGQGGVGGPANLTVGKSFSLGPLTDSVGRRVNLMKALMADFHLSAEQAAGPVGNFMAESGGINLPPDINEGDHEGAPPKFSGGYGWAQWTGPRQVSFIDFATDPAQGYMASRDEHANDAANYAWLKQELATYQAVTITELLKQSTPEDAAVSYEHTFERAGKPVLDKRKANARQAFEEFIGNKVTQGGTATGTAVSTSCGQTGGGVVDCGDAAACAAKILELADQGKFAMTDGARSNLKTIAAGSMIGDCTPPGPVSLNTTLLQLLIKLSANFKINIHNFSAPNHGCDYPKFHPRGRATDVHLEGVPADCASLGNAQNRAFAQAVMDLLPAGGGLGQKQCIGSLNNTAGKRYFDDGPAHFHIDVGKDAPGGGA